ncbi:hypothetical protein [Dyella acidiphila]|uniref:Uncharacterized protein n=1 Tax=Dyella acidiphila TaxID=2775866 RepID=A0ABR9GBT7_9GAMM|nr:hypothetical protein [Dyella acidiphila]MBE1161519.1 hypothetical protein [Dyella acidiphila]
MMVSKNASSSKPKKHGVLPAQNANDPPAGKKPRQQTDEKKSAQTLAQKPNRQSKRHATLPAQNANRR